MTPEPENESEDELGTDEEFDEDEIAGGSVSRTRGITYTKTGLTPSAKRKADAAAKRRAATDARRAQIGDIAKKRGAMEQHKVDLPPSVADIRSPTR